MKLQLKAIIKGDCYTASPIHIQSAEYEISVESQLQDTFLLISTKVLDFDKYLPKLHINSGGAGHHSLIGGGVPPERDKMIEMIQLFVTRFAKSYKYFNRAGI